MISVVIPTYNREKTIEKSVRSVLSQTYSDIEVIVVDDCSTDQTKQVIDSIKDHRVRYICLSQNSGACVARNRGIEEATGEYIAFQDSDDVWDLDKLEKQVNALEETGAEIVFCKMRYHHNGRIQAIPRRTSQGFLGKEHSLFGIGTQSLLAKKCVVESVKFDPAFLRYQDLEFLYRAAKKYSIYCVSDAMIDYAIGQDSISSNAEKMYQACHLFLKKHPDVQEVRPALTNQMAYTLLRTAKEVYASGQGNHQKYMDLSKCCKSKSSIFTLKELMIYLQMFGRPWLQNIVRNVRDGVFSAITMISPKLNTHLHYRRVFGVFPNLKEPKTFSEKLSWLKLYRYSKDPLVIQCADKYGVREYVIQCGQEELLNELYGVYDQAEDIPWESLPQQFVLKWNFGAGMNIICQDKSLLDIPQAVAQLERWAKRKFWLTYSEMHYKYIPRKIICEKYLEDDKEAEVLPDYKVYCFHGEPLAVLVMHDRGKGIKSEFFDADWNSLQNTDKYQNVGEATQKPVCLEQMLNACRELSKPFPFVRCDFYVVRGRLYFGELTFTPACGLNVSRTEVHGKDMAEYLQILE